MRTRPFTIAIIYASILASCNPTVNPKPEQEFYYKTTEEQPISPEEQKAYDEALGERTEIIRKLKENAARDWPDDYTTQEYWVNEEIDAYDHMLTVPDDEIKRNAQRDWPLDFTTQKYWYYEQIEAKERMK